MAAGRRDLTVLYLATDKILRITDPRVRHQNQMEGPATQPVQRDQRLYRRNCHQYQVRDLPLRLKEAKNA